MFMILPFRFSTLICQALLVALPLFFSPLGVDGAEMSQIVVSASGTVSVKPDLAEFTVLLQREASTADEAVRQVADAGTKVRQELLQAGLGMDDLATLQYRVEPRWEWNQELKKNFFKGYQATHTLRIAVRQAASLGRLLDVAVKAGAEEVQNIVFRSSRQESLRQQALALAVANARRDAAIIATAAGGRLGRLLEMHYPPVSAPVAPVPELRLMRASAAPGGTDILVSDQDVLVTVSSRWAFYANDRQKGAP